jgi:hypothetical protein
MAERTEIEKRDRRIKGLTDKLERKRNLVRDMRQHVERTIGLTQRWADTLYRSEDSRRKLDDALKDYENLRTEFNELVRLWNRYIEMVGPQPVGRPLQATDAQIDEVRKLRNAGASLRNIATETNLGLRTVRTITGQQDGSDRTSEKRERAAAPHVSGCGPGDPFRVSKPSSSVLILAVPATDRPNAN